MNIGNTLCNALPKGGGGVPAITRLETHNTDY